MRNIALFLVFTFVGCATVKPEHQSTKNDSRCFVHMKGYEWGKILVEDNVGKTVAWNGVRNWTYLDGNEIRYKSDILQVDKYLGKVENGQVILDLGGRQQSTPIQNGEFLLNKTLFRYSPACTVEQAALGAVTFYRMLL